MEELSRFFHTFTHDDFLNGLDAMNRLLKRLNAIQLLAIGFALIILTGALLLTLPACSRDHRPIPFLDALFTATSATCVTGLVVYDTWTQFTLLGQIILLVLIQTGGLGFMAMMVITALLLGRRIGLKERLVLMEAFSSPQLTGIVRLSRRILLGAACAEGLGAVLLAFRFVPLFGWPRGVWYSIFHAVSAFCNAGFDLMGCYEPFGSLVPFVDDWLVCGTVMALVLVGGIGFTVWDDLVLNGKHVSKYRLHTKVMLCGTLILTLGGATVFFFSEQTAAMTDMNRSDRVLASLFQAVTTRTAGFNTIDQASLSPLGGSLTLLLMFIGAGAGSTGGGLKVSTFAVLILSAVAYVRGREDVDLFRRRLDKGIERRALNGALLYTALLLCGHFLLLSCQRLGYFDALYECVSAIGTVGMSTGVTRELTVPSRVVILLMMFTGRVGSLSVAMALAERRHAAQLRNPAEKLIVG